MQKLVGSEQDDNVRGDEKHYNLPIKCILDTQTSSWKVVNITQTNKQLSVC